jgi:hypothetical protein
LNLSAGVSLFRLKRIILTNRVGIEFSACGGAPEAFFTYGDGIANGQRLLADGAEAHYPISG